MIWPLCNAVRGSNGCLACPARDSLARVYIASRNFSHLCNEGRAEISVTYITYVGHAEADRI